jgi:glycosyltransferase involved in cell wall biosynthesis
MFFPWTVASRFNLAEKCSQLSAVALFSPRLVKRCGPTIIPLQMSSKMAHPVSSVKPPTIGVLPVGDDRPFWSVMIPTYNPRADYLEQALQSVLKQDPGPDQMQIEVVDDCSNDKTAFEVANRLGPGRVTFHCESENRGLANAWNRCIERARGKWVHILHQDDIVLPGFYDRLREAAEYSDAGAIFCRHAITNPDGHWIELSELHRESAGLLEDWHAKITVQCVIQCAAIAVRRRVYEQLGGFLPRFHYVADWEMWQRIASQFPFCFDPSILACYRLHSNSATSRMRFDAADTREVRQMIKFTMTYHSLARGRVLAKKARSEWAERSVFHARELLVKVGFAPAWRQLVEVLRLSRNRRVIRKVFSFLALWFRIMGSRLKRWIKSKLVTPV